MPYIRTPFPQTILTEEEHSESGCPVCTTISPELKDEAQQHRHLFNYLHMVPTEEFGVPEYHEKLSRKLGDAEQPNRSPFSRYFECPRDTDAHDESAHDEEQRHSPVITADNQLPLSHAAPPEFSASLAPFSKPKRPGYESVLSRAPPEWRQTR